MLHWGLTKQQQQNYKCQSRRARFNVLYYDIYDYLLTYIVIRRCCRSVVSRSQDMVHEEVVVVILFCILDIYLNIVLIFKKTFE